MRKHSVKKNNIKKQPTSRNRNVVKNKKTKRTREKKATFSSRDIFYKIMIFRRISFILGLIGLIFLTALASNLDVAPLWSLLITTIPLFSVSFILFFWCKYMDNKVRKFRPPPVVV